MTAAITAISSSPETLHAETGAARNPETDGQARELFEQGQVHYTLGEYERAIAEFRRAYELSSAPGLLFNIAQSHRLNGDCKQALEIYRHFIRLAPGSAYRSEAESHVALLAVRCGAVESTRSEPLPQGISDRAPSRGLQIASTASDLRPSQRSPKVRRAAAILLATGVGVGAGTGALYWWNDRRYDEWRREDQRLSGAMSGVDTGAWISSQQRNDALLRSIQRTDSLSAVGAGISLLAIVSSAVLMIAFDH